MKFTMKVRDRMRYAPLASVRGINRVLKPIRWWGPLPAEGLRRRVCLDLSGIVVGL